MFLFAWSSTSECSSSQKEIDQVEKMCMDQHMQYNCGSQEKKNGASAKVCEEMSQCLKDPHSYKVKMEEKEWNELLDELLYYFNLTRKNALAIGLLILLFFLAKYVKIN